MQFIEELAFENGAVYKGYLLNEMAMGQESKFGQIMPSMRENGEKINQRTRKVLACFIFINFNGKMTKLMDMESIFT